MGPSRSVGSREKGQVPAYITPKDMKDWIISEGRNILKERFQMECADQRDGLIHLLRHL
ncbi:hypothetical protein AAFF_G00339000, partial [Aldrovandia affinis]